jgi:extracellular matrix regulatory protein A
MDGRLINIGFGNTVISHRVVAVVMPGSAPMKRLRERATQADRLIDATHGRKTRSIIVTDSNHIILSAVHAETLSQRMNGNHAGASRPDPEDRDI